MLAAKRVVVQEVAVEDRRREDTARPRGRAGAGRRAARAAADGITRRRAARRAPPASPAPGWRARWSLPRDRARPRRSATRRTRRRGGAGGGWSTTDGEPLRADAIEVGSFDTALPEGADKRELGSPVVVVRVDPRHAEAAARAARLGADGHPGLLADLHPRRLRDRRSSATRSTSSSPSGPALVCPCHYSTFDVRQAAEAGLRARPARPLPQLPLAIDADGDLVAAGPLSGSVGPAWWSVQAA